jgi:extracellular factor (EF) 3-hydroxypalmitic acid methyl ester biosynthesis protein
MVLTKLLNSTHENILQGDVLNGVRTLMVALYEQRLSLSERAWKDLVSVCRQHPICSVLHEDPLTQRSFTKPRGYAGDAVMLDMIYGSPHKNDPSELGRSIHHSLVEHSNTARAVRHRRSLIADAVDQMSSGSEVRILSIASGHLRELELTKAIKDGVIKEWVCLDQDADSLRECVRSYGNDVIRAVPGSVRQVLSGKLPLSEFDFVYAAGLFDYLTTPVAGALLSRMFEMLKPGGKFLVANFANTCTEIGYMEAFMDWWLIYRDEAQMKTLVEVLDDSVTNNVQIFTDPWKTIVYAVGERRQTEEPRSMPQARTAD